MDDQSTPVLPTHVGLILDGNRRWAKDHGLPTFEGHRRGYDQFKDVTKYAINKGVKYVSAFIFSTENWDRTKDEVNYLMRLALHMLTKDIAELNKENIKVVWLGSPDRLSKKLLAAIKNAEESTKNNTRGTVCICFNYGGYQEIIDSFKKIIMEKIPADKVDIETIKQSLYAPPIPPIDLLIRTSGEKRISGFMLWRMAYAELYFSDKYWPDFSNEDLDLALEDYYKRERRFGH